MAVYDKIQRSLLGKCCMPSRGIALTQALQSIGGKVPCPKGEQITNGGFETGDLTGWTELPGCEGAEIVSNYKHSGSYSVYFPAGTGAAIYQLFASAIPQICISSFGVYVKAELGYPAWGAMAYILYQGWSVDDPFDSDTTTYMPVHPPTGGFKYGGLKGRLEEEKGHVIGIIVMGIGAPESWADDVSLVGSG